ncbi:MAG: hypothetical protein Q9175_001219 [Cornicularia normoerica]
MGRNPIGWNKDFPDNRKSSAVKELKIDIVLQGNVLLDLKEMEATNNDSDNVTHSKSSTTTSVKNPRSTSHKKNAAIKQINFKDKSSNISDELAHVFCSKSTLEQKTTAMSAIAQTYWIELALILVLCVLCMRLCVQLDYLRTSTSSRKELSKVVHSADIEEYEMQQTTLIDSGDDYLPSYEETGHHVVTNMVDESLHVANIQQLAQELEDLVLLGSTPPTVYGNIHLTPTVTTKIPKEIAAGSWEPRRSGRVRQATQRFAESWYNGRLHGLGSALGVES